MSNYIINQDFTQWQRNLNFAKQNMMNKMYIMQQKLEENIRIAEENPPNKEMLLLAGAANFVQARDEYLEAITEYNNMNKAIIQLARDLQLNRNLATNVTNRATERLSTDLDDLRKAIKSNFGGKKKTKKRRTLKKKSYKKNKKHKYKKRKQTIKKN